MHIASKCTGACACACTAGSWGCPIVRRHLWRHSPTRGCLIVLACRLYLSRDPRCVGKSRPPRCVDTCATRTRALGTERARATMSHANAELRTLFYAPIATSPEPLAITVDAAASQLPADQAEPLLRALRLQPSHGAHYHQLALLAQQHKAPHETRAALLERASALLPSDTGLKFEVSNARKDHFDDLNPKPKPKPKPGPKTGPNPNPEPSPCRVRTTSTSCTRAPPSLAARPRSSTPGSGGWRRCGRSLHSRRAAGPPR